MEQRVTRLEVTVEAIGKRLDDIAQDVREIKDHARGDFRLMFGALISVALGLAALMAKGFGWL